MQLKLKVRLNVEPDGDGFHVYCPELKGMHACGDTVDEALENGIEGVRLYVVSLLKHNEPLPLGVLEPEPHSVAHIFHQLIASIFRPTPTAYIREVAVPAFA